MNVALYLRYSSDKQTEQSIEGQERVCSQFCRTEGYTITARYYDRDKTASKNLEKRTDFHRMIADAEKGEFEAVVVYAFDRFARNRYDSAIYKNRLKKAGVKLLSATERIPDSPEGIILEALLEGMAEYYSRELAQKVTRGMRESAYKGNSTGGKIPLGYKVENKKLVIDPAQAQIVRDVFRLYADGATVFQIRQFCDEQGYRTAEGKPFNKNSFHTMLKNKKYIGVYSFADIQIEGGVPAIVDRETFERVQERFAKNVKAPGRARAKVEYLLAQKLFCGHCGELMIGDAGTGKLGGVYHYYVCQTRKKKRACDKKPLKKELIERWVIEDTLELLTPPVIEELADMAIDAAKKDLENDEIIPRLEKEISDINKRLRNVNKAIELGANIELMVQSLNELSDRKKDVEKRLRDQNKEHVHLDRAQIIFWLTKFADGDPEDPDFCRDLVNMLVNSVTVWDDPDGGYKITILYNLTENNKKTFRIAPGPTSQGSDIASDAPPYQEYPNTFIYLNIVFGYTTQKHRQA